MSDGHAGYKRGPAKHSFTLLRDGRLAHAIVNRQPLSVRLVFCRENDARPDSSGKVVKSFVRTIHTLAGRPVEAQKLQLGADILSPADYNWNASHVVPVLR